MNIRYAHYFPQKLPHRSLDHELGEDRNEVTIGEFINLGDDKACVVTTEKALVYALYESIIFAPRPNRPASLHQSEFGKDILSTVKGKAGSIILLIWRNVAVYFTYPADLPHNFCLSALRTRFL
uniref:Uncharacterized protein LOC104221839 n=1 Tax=Nicotiana sylvestris TaxID=4096 RepID=A0A1U7W9E4_NICSY|nr:PREDICTED: uncharacterized protein LOC104221839 [Nicotiana sylvestris]